MNRPLAPGAAAAPISFALTLPQRDIYFDQLHAAGSPRYNVGGYISLQALDPARLARAHRRLVETHDAFGVRIDAQGDEVRQWLSTERSTMLELHDLSAEPDPEAAARAWVAQLFTTAIEFHEAELFRAALLDLGGNRYWYVGMANHLCMDGVGFANWARVLSEYYRADGDDALPAAAVWAEVAGSDLEYLQSERCRNDQAYWLEHCRPLPESVCPAHYLAELAPADRLRSDRVRLEISTARHAEIGALAERLGVGTSHLLLGVLTAYFGLVHQRDRLIFGLPIHNRSGRLQKQMIGVFTSISPTCLAFDAEAPFATLARSIAEQQRRNFRHQRYPLGDLVRALGAAGGSRSLFDVTFSYLKLDAQVDIGGIDADLHYVSHGHEATPLMLTVWEYGDARPVELLFDFNRCYFKLAEIERLGERLLHLLGLVVENPERILRASDLLPAAERRLLLDQATPAPQRSHAACIHQLFEAQVGRCPEAIAVEFAGRALSYRELDARSNRVAHCLRERGVGREQLVGICVDRSLDMLVGLLGILKAGGAYVPLDPTYPAARLQGILDDSALDTVLTRSTLLGATPISAAQALLLDDEHALSRYPGTALPPGPLDAQPSDRAYIIYTSGSTGRPKGVEILHRSAVTLIDWASAVYSPRELARVLASTSLNFDLSVFELFVPLSLGHRCVLVADALALLQEPVDVTLVNTVPSAIKLLLEQQAVPSSVQVVNLAGEALQGSIVNQLLEETTCTAVYNLYGPSEDTTYSTFAGFDRPLQGAPSIGRPIAGTYVYVLSPRMELLPYGEVGELYIGGDGLARGYLNQPALTAERFVANPFSADPAARLYRTGDVVRFLPDGALAYLGRADHQVKIRGFRVEPGEVETTLRRHAAVRDVVVVATAAPARLVAYVVAADAASTTALIGELLGHLRAQLPEYMVPSVMMRLDALPLTQNGKVDRKALPAVDLGDQIGSAYAAPTTAVETALAGIWSELLRHPRIGVDDSFFTIGGDSILAMQCIARAREAGIRFSARQLFELKTIRAIAREVGTCAGPNDSQHAVQGSQLLLPIHRMMLRTLPLATHHYNHAVLLQPPAGFDRAQLAEILTALYQRHDALRLRFGQVDGRWQAHYRPFDQAMLEASIVERRLPTADPQCLQEHLRDEGQRIQESISLADGPLLRAALFVAGTDSLRLLLVLHHLVVDGLSWRVLLHDIERAHQQLQRSEAILLAEKSGSLQRWAQILHAHAGSDALAAERAFWLDQLQRPMPALPRDAAVEALADGVPAGRLEIELDAGSTRALLHESQRAYVTRVDELLLAALLLGLQRWSGATELRIDLEGHGRESIDESIELDETVGWFTSVFPLALRASTAPGIGALVRSTKEQLRTVPRRGLGFGLLHELAADAELIEARRSAPSELLFNYLGQFDAEAAEGAFRLRQEFAGRSTSERLPCTHPLELNAMVVAGRLAIELKYDRRCFAPATVAGLLEQFRTALLEVVDHCRQQSRVQYSPSDFPSSAVSAAELDDWQQRYPGLEDLYASTPMQRGMLFHSDGDRSAYVTQVALRLSATTDVDAFRTAWQQLVERHAVFRTAFVGPRLDQLVLRRSSLPWFDADWSAAGPDVAARFEAQLADDRGRGFDPQAAPLMRFSLLRQPDRSYRFIWSLHHALIDGWSMAQVFAEVVQLYRSLRTGTPPALPAPAAYARFIAWRRRYDVAAAQAFWREQLAGFAAATPLCIDRLPPAAATAGPRELRFALDTALSSRLQTTAQDAGVTLNTVIQAAWALLLQRYSGERRVLFGETVAGRPAELAGIETTVGLFINSVPVPVEVDPTRVVRDWLQALHQAALARADFVHLALPEIQAQSEMALASPLFDSLVVFENYPIGRMLESIAGSGLEVDDLRLFEQSNFAVTVQVTPGEQLGFELKYRAERIPPTAMERLAAHLRCLLAGIAQDPQTTVGAIPMLEAAERASLLPAAERPAPCPRELGIAAQFETWVARQPGAIAAVEDARTLSYAELDARANQLVHALIGSGVASGDRVVICVERGLDMVVGMLGILKAGAAYVPLDPSYPQERLLYMLADSAPSAVITQSALRPRLGEPVVPLLVLDSPEGVATLQRQPISPPSAGGRCASGDALAYVIYTSGSTGQPKGVMIDQRSVLRLVIAPDYITLGADSVIAQASNTSFDAATFEVWGALLNGGRLVHVGKECLLDPVQLQQQLRRHRVNVMFVTTAVFNQVARIAPTCFGELDCLLFGGELASVAAVRTILEQGCPGRLLHVYGPTENTTFSTWYPVSVATLPPNTGVPIGGALAGTRLRVLDATLQPVPIGITGELYLGGDGLARGYLGRPELTAERFVADPHADRPDARLYRTGDLVRWLDHDVLEFIGRADDQIKLRGFRIELGEVEAALLAVDGVKHAVVAMHEATQSLAGYLVPDAAIDDLAQWPATVQGLLRQRLPEYMVPTMFAVLDALPLTANGKVDRRALPAPLFVAPAPSIHHGPRTDTEQALCEICAALLGREQVDTETSFFDLGMNSLLIMSMVGSICARMKVDLRVADAFTHNTVRRLAAQVERAERVDAGSIPRLASRQRLPLSFSQQRLWFVEQLDGSSHQYNISAGYRLRGRLDRVALLRAFNTIVFRHEVLRTVYDVDGDGQAVQSVLPGQSLALAEADLTALAADAREAELARMLRAEALTPFDLRRDPMLRIALLRLADQQHALLFTMHHIAADGWSIRVLVDEFVTLYEAYSRDAVNPLADLPIQYADYADWQRRTLSAAVLEQQLAYWRRYLADAPQLHGLPLDRARPPQRDFAGGRLLRRVDPATASALDDLARAHDASIGMLLQTAFALLLVRWSNDPEVVIAVPMAGRHHHQTAALIGFFVDTVVFRCTVGESARFVDLLAATRADYAAAFSHRDLPFDQLVDALQPDRLLNCAPLAQIAFSLRGNETAALRLPGIEIEPIEEQVTSVRFDLELAAEPASDGVTLEWRYASALFDAASIEQLATAFEQLLHGIAAAPQADLAELCCNDAVDEPRRRAFEQRLVVPDGEALPDPRRSGIDAREARVLDLAQRPLPLGAIGEWVLLGPAPGSNATADADPLPTGAPDLRMHRTGVLARWRADGSLQRCGRIDQQVRLGGLRFGLDEVAEVLREHADVTEACVHRVDHAGGPRLVAFVVATASLHAQPAPLQQLLLWLRARLPRAMLPAGMALVAELPRRSDGTLDIERLPAPAWLDAPTGRAPRSADEQRLAAVWQSLLQVERISLDDDFFALGGNSLTAVRLEFALLEQFGRAPSVRELFEHPTLEAQARLLGAGASTSDELPPIDPVPRSGEPLPLSFAQQRLWFIDQLEPGNCQYNLPSAFRLRGTLDPQALQRALDEIVERHEVLRTIYAVTADGEPRQRILPAGPVPIEHIALDDANAAQQDRQLQAIAARELATAFDLAGDLPIRVRLLRLAANDCVLLVTMHHIASDGWSIGLLTREFNALYAAYAGIAAERAPSPLPALPIQYADYAHWQRAWLRDERLDARLDYWRERLRDAPALHRLPTDRPRPPQQRFAGGSHTQRLDRPLLDRLQAFGRAHDATLFMVLQSAFAVLLQRLSKADDIVIGSPVAGRGHGDVKALIGCFVNTLAFRFRLSDAISFSTLLAQSRADAIDALAHQDLPFDLLVDALQLPRSLGHAPVFQVTFALQNNEQVVLELPELSIEPMPLGDPPTQFDLTLMATEDPNGLALQWIYATALFDATTIGGFAEHFAGLLQALLDAPELPLQQLPQVTGKTRDRLAQVKARLGARQPALAPEA